VPEDISKVFINICKSSEIAEAKATLAKRNGKTGQSWNIPYSLTTGRQDTDSSNNKCMVYDCVFNPKTLDQGLAQPPFLDLLIQTALEGIEKQFQGVKLDRAFKRLKNLKSKGEIKSTVVRTPLPDHKNGDLETTTEYLEKIQQIAKAAQAPEPSLSSSPTSQPSKSSTSGKDTIKTPLIQELSSTLTENGVDDKLKGIKIPNYTIVHSGNLTYQNFINSRELNSTSTRPEFLIIKISLPDLSSAADVDLDTQETFLDLKVPGKYTLHIPFKFPVKHEDGTAKFDKSKRELIVKLPVLPAQAPSLVSYCKSCCLLFWTLVLPRVCAKSSLVQ
jgi:dynein assembly factor 2